MNNSYNIDIAGLFGSLGLGVLICEPTPLSGGHLHRVYKAETPGGVYAVKAINPQVIARPAARKNYIDSENIARIASKRLPALPANVYGENTLQEYDGQFYLIYNFIYGVSLPDDSLSPSHCAEMGRLLAVLHSTDFSELGLADDYSYVESETDWSEYLRLGGETGAAWCERIGALIDKLNEWQTRFIAASSKLSDGTVISHGDLEPKNVLWVGGSPLIIDWEAAGYIHPAFDLVQNALYWARNFDSYDEDKLTAFFRAYALQRHGPPLCGVDPETIADKCIPLLGWLEYSLRRSLGIESADDAERKMGTDHVFYSLSMLEGFERSVRGLFR